VNFDGEARPMVDLTAPVQFIADVMQLVAKAIKFAPHVLMVPVAIVELVIDVLETGTGAGEFIVNVAAGAMVVGFVFEMALPLPKAVDIGMDIVVPMVGSGARSERDQTTGYG
jgi:hypothetical protein